MANVPPFLFVLSVFFVLGAVLFIISATSVPFFSISMKGGRVGLRKTKNELH